jgi:hypothetical protein
LDIKQIQLVLHDPFYSSFYVQLIPFFLKHFMFPTLE